MLILTRGGGFLGEWTDEQVAGWQILFGERRIPGSGEPVVDKCAAKIRNRSIRDLEGFLGIERSGLPARYCTRPAGDGTNHWGFGPCKTHLGRTPNVVKKYYPVAVNADLHTLAELWEEPIGLDPAPVEAERLFLKMKKMTLALEQLVLELGNLDTEDTHGRQQAKSVVELYERSVERLSDFLKFALKFNLAERRVEILENDARDLGNAVMSAVMDPTLQLEQWQVSKIRQNLQKVLVDLSPRLQPDWADEFENDNIINLEEEE